MVQVNEVAHCEPVSALDVLEVTLYHGLPWPELAVCR
jgi:hypothetical protein